MPVFKPSEAKANLASYISSGINTYVKYVFLKLQSKIHLKACFPNDISNSTPIINSDTDILKQILLLIPLSVKVENLLAWPKGASLQQGCFNNTDLSIFKLEGPRGVQRAVTSHHHHGNMYDSQNPRCQVKWNSTGTLKRVIRGPKAKAKAKAKANPTVGGVQMVHCSY